MLGLVVEGRSNQQIARGLGLSLRTVATHLEHILHKLEVQTRTLPPCSPSARAATYRRCRA